MFTSARFCCNPHQFYRCIKEERTVPSALGNTAARSTVTIQSADGTIYVQGTSDVTVTVSSCTTQIDTTGASTVDNWNSYAAAAKRIQRFI